jgi:membrane associated rhomboid family serine protease
MGWRDREYAAGGWDEGGASWPSRRSALRGRSIVTTLILINAAIFVVCQITMRPGRAFSAEQAMLTSPVFRFMAMHPGNVLHGEVWRLLTAQYLHWSFMHIFMNMLGLHFLGRPLERDWGSRAFLAVYTVAGTLGMIALTGLVWYGWLEAAPAAGASGCVLGLLGAAAVRYPRAEVLIYFLFPIKIRTAALVFGGWYVLNLYQRGPNAGGDACHLAGLVFGAWWAFRGESWWDRTGWKWSQWRGRPRKVRVRRFTPGFERRVADGETIDRILKKVYDGGIHSLTEAEKRTLQEATERQRAADAGRMD